MLLAVTVMGKVLGHDSPLPIPKQGAPPLETKNFAYFLSADMKEWGPANILLPWYRPPVCATLEEAINLLVYKSHIPWVAWFELASFLGLYLDSFQMSLRMENPQPL